MDHNYYARYKYDTKTETPNDIWSFDNHKRHHAGQDFYIIISLLFTILNLIEKREYDKLRKLIAVDQSISYIQRNVFNPDHDDIGQITSLTIKANVIPNYYDTIPEDIKSDVLNFFLSTNELSDDDLALIIRLYGGYKYKMDSINQDWDDILDKLREYYRSVIIKQIGDIYNAKSCKRKKRVPLDCKELISREKDILKSIRDKSS